MFGVPQIPSDGAIATDAAKSVVAVVLVYAPERVETIAIAFRVTVGGCQWTSTCGAARVTKCHHLEPNHIRCVAARTRRVGGEGRFCSDPIRCVAFA